MKDPYGRYVSYTYNAEGLRTRKDFGEKQINYYYDRGNIILETDQNNQVTARNIRGNKLIYRDTDSSLYYYLHDAHGDVIKLTDETGLVIKDYSYNPYGVEEIKPIMSFGNSQFTALWQRESEVIDNPFRYAGEYFDLSSGTYYLRARYYDPVIGRFTAEDPHWNPRNMIYGDNPVKINEHQDPLGLTIYTYAPDINAITQSTNLYVYCGNNPVMYIDQDGEIFMLVTGGIGAVVGGVAGGIYSYAKYGEVRWQNVAGGAAIGGVIGLTGGAGASLLATAGSTTGITALASTSAVATGLGAGATAGGTIVIGQTMSRVIDKAQSIGAEVYNGCKYYDTLKGMFGSKAANFIGKADNALWIINKMAQNYKIVDIGIDVNKALGNSSYTLESILTFFYKNKDIAAEFLKGAF